MGIVPIAVVAVGLYFLTRKKEAFKHTPEQTAAIFDTYDGWRHYKAPMKALILSQLAAKGVSGEGDSELILSQYMSPGDVLQANEMPAHAAAALLHAEGYTLWISDDIHLPSAEGQTFRLFFTKAGLPPANEKGRLALLLAPQEAFPA